MRIRDLSQIRYTLAVLMPFLFLDDNKKVNSAKDEIQVSSSNSVSVNQVQFNVYSYVKGLSENRSFVQDVKSTVQALPKELHKFIFEPEDRPGYKIFVWDKLLSDVHTQFQAEMRYLSGCTSDEEKRIDISTKVRRKGNDRVEDYKHPRNITGHELGHAFDNMLFELYFSDDEKDSKDKYYSCHSEIFKEAYEKDVKDLLEKIKKEEIPIEIASKIVSSYYINTGTNPTGRIETFAEIFLRIMLAFDDVEYAKTDFKRIPDFLSFFPRSKEVVLDQIEFLSPGFKGKYNEAAKLSSGL